MQIEAADAGRAPAASPKLRLAGDALLRDAVQRVASRGMYVPSWPGLNPRLLFRAGPAREPLFPLNAPHRTYAYVARSLIYHLFRTLSMGNGSTVLVPDYHHGNEIRAIRAAGATLRFYRIGRDLEPDLEQLESLCRSGARALVVIHYLGWPQPIREIAALCRKNGVLLIEDCALSLFSESRGRPLGSFGDHAVFCLYKTLPLPHGALLVQNREVLQPLDELQLPPCGFLSVAARSAELMLEWTRSRWNAPGKGLFAMKRAAGRLLSAARVRRVPVGGAGFDAADAGVGMSGISRRLLGCWDYRNVRRRRRRHFRLLLKRFSGRVALLPRSLEPGMCPLGFPILVRDKGQAARALWARGIQAIEFWNQGDSEAEASGSSEAAFLRRHVLELPIHQELSPAQVEYMAEQVLSLDACRAPE